MTGPDPVISARKACLIPFCSEVLSLKGGNDIMARARGAAAIFEA
jgi:hypothetical protein